MNVYNLKFKAKCPHGDDIVEYDWTLFTCYVYMAEELRRVADEIGEGLHEKIADALYERFSGQQKIIATHVGQVHIETRRPEFVHWARPGRMQDGATP